MFKKIKYEYLLAFLIGILLYEYGVFIGLGGKNIPVMYIEVISFVMCIFMIIKNKSIFRIDKLGLGIIFLIFIFSIVPLAYNFNIRSIEGIKTSFFMMLIYISFFNLFRRSTIQTSIKVFNIILLTFMICTFIGIINIVITNKLYNTSQLYMYKSYIILPYGASNYIAEFILYFIVVNFVSMINENSLKSLILVSIGIVSLLITNSRGALLALILTVAIFIIFNVRKIKISGIVIMCIGAVALFIINSKLPFMDLMIDRFLSENNNVSYRWDQYLGTLKAIYFGNPITLMFGLGMGSELANSPMLIHNVILKLLHNVGFIGLMTYFTYYSIYIYRLKKCIPKFNELKKYLYGFIAIFIGSLFEVALYTPFMEYFIVINFALVSCLYSNANKLS